MGPEFWVTVASAFVAGGAIGSSGMLLAQWILKKVDGDAPNPLQGPEYRMLRTEVAHLGKQMRNVDSRLDFAEQLLGGALPLAPAPSRLEPKEFEESEDFQDAEDGTEADTESSD
ncbi:MAG: hypothetical protein GWP44_11250 [Proteobacteria bacterium]|jgi:hypothetical protein|nr:hypothetical protein [Gemmatimonadales bacterium]MBT6376061.1 hypothetical protein [Gemmatimonadales bacterium]MBT6888566.1 hypothetical protein [Gemmatimonadales bacterium]MBT7123957.1 hypothetical protein [Gemmatimonadales bacterium]NCG33443.1 hypothetical protein [Pseudomonadota bacterium]